ncbi:MAG: hypothetical protein PUH35_01975 [Bacteroidales bacterium]|uniref:hypothetical protein n=1 Tax=Candidatus Cryptobacteroides sp. TaxID=2952915 RepID=UPI002A75EC47|nr:hypothetical protein [Candidatus Cryptobacteroides sp.]MDD7234240.1 hypothetical protein [Bacteroidales bacterium]MDY2701243.1 hypothetical protein [Candidatus Cryptobacteroides sp.]MDY5782219.1 hypothetical protein [Candidatus Cryptobacteroides sp.]
MATGKQQIQAIYINLKQQYAVISKPLLDDIWNNNINIERPKVMFPPNEGSTFDAQVAESGFLQRNCAILSACRSKNQDGSTRSEEDNTANTAKLKSELTESGFGIIPVDGCFREARQEKASHESSFFVYDDGKHNAREFFTKLYLLSEKYEQDSFLYKSAGMTRTAFLISTNDDSRKDNGDIALAGQLYLNLPPVGPYTNLDKGRFRFMIEKPSAEDLAYSEKYK